MKKLGLSLTGLVIAGLLIAAPWRADSRAPGADGSGTADSSQLARLDAELAALRGRVHRLDGVQSSTAEKVRDLASGPGADSSAPAQLETPTETLMSAPVDEEAARQQAMERASAQAELLDQTLGLESVDPTWAPWAEGELQRSLAELEGATGAAVRCTSTLCRMELDFATPEAQERSLDGLAELAPWDGQGFFRMDKESLSLVLYLARDGEVLPRAG